MIIRTEQDLDYVVRTVKKSPYYCLDTETMHRRYPDIGLVGLSVGWSETEGVYIPVGHLYGNQLDKEFVLDRLQPIFESDKLLVMHNAKYDMQVLSLHGKFDFLELFNRALRSGTYPKLFDTMIASWLLDTENSHGLKDLIQRYRGHTMTELTDFCREAKDSVTGKKMFMTNEVDIETMGKYAIEDCTQPIWLMNHFTKLLDEEGFGKVFFTLEMPKVFLLTSLERNGIKINRDMLQEHKVSAPIKLAQIEKDLYKMRPSKEPFNPNSTKQLNEVLIGELGVKPIGEVQKSGLYSMNKDNLDAWSVQYPICEKILEYRQLNTLYGTFIKSLDSMMNEDGRIRTKFTQILSTGRLSSSEPNLQNMPREENDIFNLRGLFCAEPDHVLIVADYSQVELRVLAHISQDPEFVRAFQNGEDLHSFAAKILFNLDVDLKEVKSKYHEQRSIGKTFNFATVYEAGIKKLAQNAKVSEKKALELKNRYMNRFIGIKQYIERQHALAERDGFVRTLTGRKRHLPDAQLSGNSKKDNGLKQSAFRKASNSTVQGSAADIIFIAMRNIYREWVLRGLTDKARFVLQVHDEVVVEVHKSCVDEVSQIVKSCMEDAVQLRVPLIADLGVGDVWSDAKG